MKSLFTSIFIIVLISSCAENQPVDVDINTPDLEFISGAFEYVNGINQYGVPADQWAGGSAFTFYYISDSESGKPQGRFIWTFRNDQTPIKAWWRFDAQNNSIAIFGEGGTAGHLSLSDFHAEVSQNWRTIYINESGHLVMDETNQDPIRWEFERISQAPNWTGE